MRERAKILVGNREVAKRYIGSRLVWESEGLTQISLRNIETKVYGKFIAFRLENESSRFEGKNVKKIHIENATSTLVVDPSTQTTQLSGSALYLNNVTEDIKVYFTSNGVSVFGFRPINITFYLTERK